MKGQKQIVREENERKIVAAAEHEFAYYGFKGATTERISKQAGLPKANIHYYFKTKSDLYRVVLERILDEWIIAAEVFDNFEEPREAVTQYVEAKMKFSRLRPLASKVWANEVLHGAQVAEEFLATTLKSWLNDRVNVVNGWVESGKVDSIDPHAFFYMIWSMTQHYADFGRQIEIINHGRRFTDEEYRRKTEQVIQLVLASIGLNSKVREDRDH